MWFYESGRDGSSFVFEADNYCLPHFHRSVEMLFVKKGEKRVFVDGEEYILKAGDLLVCPPYSVHRYDVCEGSVQIVVTIPAELCEAFVSKCESLRPETLVIKDDGRLSPLFSEFSDARNEILFSGLANHVLGIFVQSVAFRAKKAVGNDFDVKDVAEYIDKRYAERLTLTGAARAFGYSPNYFSFLFKKYFSVSFTGYLNETRIRKSLRLLGKKKISAVCYECGFNSPQQYYINFGKVFGYPPSEYLKGDRSAYLGG